MIRELHEEYVTRATEDRMILVGQLEFKEEMIQELIRKSDCARRQVEMANKIIERARTIDFERNEGGRYAITVTFNGDFMGGISRYGEPLEYIAERVARDIQREIATSRFVETADQNERRRMASDMRLRSMIGPPGPPDFRQGERGWMEGNSGH